MKIIIIGMGRTGCALVKALSEKNYDITVVDSNRSIVDEVTDKYNVSGVVGSGASKAALLKAGAGTADVLIALTPVDEVNLLCCMQAKALGTLKTAARVFSPDFESERDDLTKEHGIDYIFNPKYDIAEEAVNSIGLPGNVKPEGLFGDRMQMVTVTVSDDSPLSGRSLQSISKDATTSFLISTVLRDGKLIVPDGSFVLEPGDSIGISAHRDNMFNVLKSIGIVRNPVKKVMLVGGGISAEYMTELLLNRKKSVTLIAFTMSRCSVLMEKFPNVNVSYGEGELTEVLEDEHIGDMDALVSATDEDEKNMVTSMYAWSRNVPSVITRIDSPEHLKLLHRVNLDITLSPSEISVDKLVRFILNCEVGSAQNEIEKYCTIADNKAEVLQFTAGDNFLRSGVPFMKPEFKLRKNVIIASIIRDKELIIPNGSSIIKKDDKVIVVSEKKNHIESLNDIFR